MSYVVDAPLVLARDQEGKIHHHYQGGVISWLSDDQAEHLVGLGMVHKSGSAPAAEEAEPAAETDGAPAKSAHKDDWVEYAVAQGYDRDEVKALSKADIQALDFG